MREERMRKVTGGKNDGEKEGKKIEGPGMDNTHYRDSSGKTIFKDPILCAQFLRNYVDIPILKDVRPEDMEDVSERYVHMFTEERNSDVVKKINLKNNSFYLVSLIEHKSDVDYNVVMQVFRYITYIWEDYEKEQEKRNFGASKRKDFRYPPILPVIFYDGAENWTAATSLHERVLFSDILGKYIPDYQCLLIQLKQYSNADLMKRKDEFSFLMMIDKLENAEDYTRLNMELREDFVKEVLKESPEYLLKLMSEVVEMFLSKLNIPQEEVDIFTGQIKERKMGELFKHFQGWDVQAIRKEAREEARKEVREELREEIKEEVKEEVKKEAREESIHKVLNIIKKYHGSREEAVRELMEEYGLSEENAAEKVALYW